MKRRACRKSWPAGTGDSVSIRGIVVQHWGEPRVTRDLDISIFTGFGAQDPFVDDLLAEFSPRIENARAFALKHRVLLLSTETGVPIDVALAALPFESEMIDRASFGVRQ
ncbi:MAG: hypothetical protein WEE89_18755 [Gemmatimonadota bacterium]